MIYDDLYDFTNEYPRPELSTTRLDETFRPLFVCVGTCTLTTPHLMLEGIFDSTFSLTGPDSTGLDFTARMVVTIS